MSDTDLISRKALLEGLVDVQVAAKLATTSRVGIVEMARGLVASAPTIAPLHRRSESGVRDYHEGMKVAVRMVAEKGYGEASKMIGLMLQWLPPDSPVLIEVRKILESPYWQHRGGDHLIHAHREGGRAALRAVLDALKPADEDTGNPNIYPGVSHQRSQNEREERFADAVEAELRT